MLDGLLNRGFSSKCKSLIKATRTRIEVLRRRAEAKQRFLKEDLAKLLANGLDINAFGRTEEFLAGLNLLSCYDFIEQSCDYVVKNLASMQKQRECPEECREAVASLMFAAARFSDLPELRDIRDLFQERYGSSFECFVSQKFVEKLSSRPPIMEKRIQLLQDIASEYSMKWDSRGFERRMTASSTPAQAQAKIYGHSNVAIECNLLNGNGNVAKSDTDDILPKETPRVSYIGHRINHGREGNDARREELGVHFYGRKDRNANGHEQLSYKGESIARNQDDILFHEREDRVGKHERWVEKNSSLSKVEKSTHSSIRKQLDSSGIAYTNQDDVKNDVRREELDLHFYGRKERSANGCEQLSSKGESIARNQDDILFNEREEDRVGKHERWVKKDSSLSKVEKSSRSSNRKRLDSSGIAYTDQDDVKNDMYKRETWRALSQEKTSVSPTFEGISGKNEHVLFAGKNRGIPGKKDNILLPFEDGSSQNKLNLPHKVQEDEIDGLKSYQCTPRPPPYVKSTSNAIPPPYVKPKDGKQKTARNSEHAGSSSDVGHYLDPLLHNRADEVKSSDGIRRELANPVHEGRINGSTRVRSHEKEKCYEDDKIPLPKPRSMRRRHHKSSSNHNDVNHIEDAGSAKRSSSSRRRDHSQKGLQILVDYEHYRKDEEEKIIDKLLLHYSKKPSNHGDVGNSRKNAKPSHQGAHDTFESSLNGDGYDAKTNILTPPSRSVSLPHEQSASSEAKKVFTRANSFQPDSQARHVHPKLPDYDDLAARFAALKGR